MNATVTVGTIRIKTYPEPAAEDLPIYAENRVHQRSSGRPYPNKIVLNVERSESLMREYTVVRLENDFLAVEILPDIGGRIFSALAHAQVNVRMIDQGSSELNIIIGVDNTDFETAVRAIYDIFVKTRF